VVPPTPLTGNLVFKVIDSTGKPLAGAKVVSEEQPDGQLKVTGMTDTNGTVTFNNMSGLVIFTLGGHTLQYTTQFGQFGDIFVRTRATELGTSVVVQNLVTNPKTPQ
jgi:hypothetical protein